MAEVERNRLGTPFVFYKGKHVGDHTHLTAHFNNAVDIESQERAGAVFTPRGSRFRPPRLVYSAVVEIRLLVS